MPETEMQKLGNAQRRELAATNEYVIFTGDGWESSEYGSVEGDLANYLDASLDGDEWMLDTDKITAYVSTHRVYEHISMVENGDPNLSQESVCFEVVETPAGKLMRLAPAVIAAARELKTKEAGDEWMAAYRKLLEAVEAFDA